MTTDAVGFVDHLVQLKHNEYNSRLVHYNLLFVIKYVTQTLQQH